ncbi:MAG TPA: hypothetical protein VGQ83_42185 [Polyangia bacterium]|jgi:hypothetical protein
MIGRIAPLLVLMAAFAAACGGLDADAKVCGRGDMCEHVPLCFLPCCRCLCCQDPGSSSGRCEYVVKCDMCDGPADQFCDAGVEASASYPDGGTLVDAPAD